MKHVVERFTADNGDVFEKISNVEKEPSEVVETRCHAVYQTEPVEHLSYYREDGSFIATAGVHVWRKFKSDAVLDQYVYISRISEATQNDNVARVLYKEA